jgi:hypothetical protein
MNTVPNDSWPEIERRKEIQDEKRHMTDHNGAACWC